MNNLFDIENKLFNFYKYIARHSSTFFDTFEDTYFKNACTILNSTDVMETCSTILNGNLKYGLSNAQHNLFSWMDQFNAMIADQSVNAPLELKNSEIKRNVMIEIASSLKNTFRSILYTLVVQSRNELKRNYDDIMRILLIILVTYGFLL